MSAVPFLPCVDPNTAPRPAVLAAGEFAYLGTPLTLEEFPAYLAAYDFGSVPPDQVVLHNTANPDASWAPLGKDDATWWDRDEDGLSLTAVCNKRQKQLDAIKAYYVSLGWNAGPHLFVDDRWIWLFTPLYDVGIHAKEGNSYQDTAGRLHYTIGIEVIGWYGRVVWPPAIQVMVRSAVQALQARLKTFEIVYKPAPAHQPAMHQGSIAFHYSYNKPECPGAQITPSFAIRVLQERPAPPPLPIPDPLKAELLPGVNGHSFACSVEVAAFVALKGKGGLFGLATANETHAMDASNHLCSFMPFERVCVKRPVNGPTHLALIAEAKSLEWI